jgi:putative FmdB family regulatory protein
MPLYEYQCDACGHRFERIQKFSDPPVEKCPQCGGTVRKLISSPAIQFKGSGWYVTDYARKSESGGKSDPGIGTGASETSAAGSDTSSSEKEPTTDAAKDKPKEAAKEGSKEPARTTPEKATPGSKT